MSIIANINHNIFMILQVRKRQQLEPGAIFTKRRKRKRRRKFRRRRKSHVSRVSLNNVNVTYE